MTAADRIVDRCIGVVSVASGGDRWIVESVRNLMGTVRLRFSSEEVDAAAKALAIFAREPERWHEYVDDVRAALGAIGEVEP